ncbi:MAG TPA: hypothetical protein VES73_07845 [Lamprocystis sp. (in: g-proteobacteria)]|nr:hypothetical protein [Lamprocystis sp. (in: g-proteobacteria)]
MELFIRHCKRLLGLTEPGKELLPIVERILLDIANPGGGGGLSHHCGSP